MNEYFIHFLIKRIFNILLTASGRINEKLLLFKALISYSTYVRTCIKLYAEYSTEYSTYK